MEPRFHLSVLTVKLTQYTQTFVFLFSVHSMSKVHIFTFSSKSNLEIIVSEYKLLETDRRSTLNVANGSIIIHHLRLKWL